MPATARTMSQSIYSVQSSVHYSVHPGVAMVQKWGAEITAEDGTITRGVDRAGEQGRTSN